jgi:hypothetical protein
MKEPGRRDWFPDFLAPGSLKKIIFTEFCGKKSDPRALGHSGRRLLRNDSWAGSLDSCAWRCRAQGLPIGTLRPPPSVVLLRGPMRPHAGAVSLTLGSIRAGHIRRSGATLATSFLNLIASLPPDYGADSIGGLVERWYYVIGLTLGPGRSLMHGVAPQMCGRVASPLLGRGAGGRSPGYL